MKLFPENTDIKLLQEQENVGKSFSFDYDKKQFVIDRGSPKEIKDKEAIRNWIMLLLNVYHESANVYKGEGFGTTIKDLVGNHAYPKGFIESEIERELKEKMRLNPFIEDLSAFSFERKTKGLNIQFTVILKNGEKVEINHDG